MPAKPCGVRAQAYSDMTKSPFFSLFISVDIFRPFQKHHFGSPASPSIDAAFPLCIHTSAPPPALLAWRASALHQRAVYRTGRKDAGEVTKGRACPPSSETREEAAGRRCQQNDMPSRALIRVLRAFPARLGILVPLQRLFPSCALSAF